jgi:hypothetical protein
MDALALEDELAVIRDEPGRDGVKVQRNGGSYYQ